MSADLHGVGGEKGGVGKSTVAKRLCEYLRENQIPFTAFDTDRSAPDLKKAYAKPESKIEVGEAFFSEAKKHQEAANELIKVVEDKIALFNLSAASFSALSHWLESNEVFDIIRGENNFYLWFVTDGSVESVSSLKESLKIYGKDIRHIVVKSEARNETKDWKLIDKDLEVQELTEKYQVSQIVFPEFYGVETFRLIRDNSLGFQEGIDRAEELKFTKFDKQRIKRFLRESGEVIDSLGIFKEYNEVNE